MMCPDRDELIELLDHELGERRAAEVRAHVARCAACRDRLAALTRLVDDLRAPIAPPGEAPAHAVARAMRRLDEPVPRPRPAWPRFALAITVATAVGGVAVTLGPARDGGRFVARGGGPTLAPGRVTAQAIAREVGTTLFALGPQAQPLADGAHVLPSTAFVLGYRNLSREVPLFLLAFAVDARREVHWLYPSYTTAGEDPAAVRLDASDTTRLAPESVVLDAIPPGPLAVIVVVSAEPLHVSAIEPLHGDELAGTALQRRFASAAVTEQHLEVSPEVSPEVRPEVRPEVSPEVRP